MAQIFTIKCPKCGNVFRVDKGVLMSWDFSNPIPLSLQEETPFNCPSCNHTMSLQDEHFNDHVLQVIDAD